MNFFLLLSFIFFDKVIRGECQKKAECFSKKNDTWEGVSFSNINKNSKQILPEFLKSIYGLLENNAMDFWQTKTDQNSFIF
jgi:hypothetical protein